MGQEKTFSCQLKKVYESIEIFTHPPGIVDTAALLLRRAYASLIRRIKRLDLDDLAGNARCLLKSLESHSDTAEEEAGTATLDAGDPVEVRSLAEIKSTLKDGKTRGLEFLPGMAKFCGKKARIMKRVRYMFDERAWKMRKCNSLLLEGVICDGREMLEKEGCDRCCYFFWKEEWLKKIEE